ncbi:hypothetical protein BKG89_10110 [Rodentibacter caecimuris]|uniref:Uncharacterized protein n=1 Tax=Rodentibacter caecimuris TaxID=1796644 RepID=A0ABX3KVF8_9PAST|nr:hypothetical protein BKG89_10110 [Rodentibacter heylii]
MLVSVIWLSLSALFYFYVLTHYIFLPFSGQYLVVSVSAWTLMIYGLLYSKHHRLKKLHCILRGVLILSVIHLILSLLLCWKYPGKELFQYQWKNIWLGMLGILIGAYLYKRLKK